MHLISLSGFAIQFTVLLFSIFITKAPSLQQDESKLSLGHTFSRHFLPASLVLSSPAHVRKAERQRRKGGGGGEPASDPSGEFAWPPLGGRITGELLCRLLFVFQDFTSRLT